MQKCWLTVAFLIIGNLSISYGQQEPPKEPVREFQLSLFPYIGTDGMAAQDHRYLYSINLFGGITGGVERFEAGGLLNITRGNVNGIQLSGFGNLVSGNLQGFQGAGFLNLNAGNSSGFLWAGFANISGGNYRGFQGSGFVNVAGGNGQGFSGAGFANVSGGNYQGFAGAGFVNIAGGNLQGFMGAGFANIAGGNYQGVAGAGFANITGGNMQGFMGAGFANVAGGNVLGIQGAGFGNISSGTVHGAQLAGFVNISEHIYGLQASGFINVASEVNGIQFGMVNFADTIRSGLPVGLFSIVKKGGLKQVEIATSDAFFISASFRTGVDKFYNIITLGNRPFSNVQLTAIGYGVGTGFSTGEHTTMQVELHSTPLNDFWGWSKDQADILNELRINLGVNSGNTHQIFGGLVLYNQVYKEDESRGITGRSLAPQWVFMEDTWGSFSSRWWIGARAGIRINL